MYIGWGLRCEMTQFCRSFWVSWCFHEMIFWKRMVTLKGTGQLYWNFILKKKVILDICFKGGLVFLVFYFLFSFYFDSLLTFFFFFSYFFSLLVSFVFLKLNFHPFFFLCFCSFSFSSQAPLPLAFPLPVPSSSSLTFAHI